MQSGPTQFTGPHRLRILRTGTDLVQVSRIAESLDNFGEKFVRRLFTAHEIAYAASSEALRGERSDDQGARADTGRPRFAPARSAARCHGSLHPGVARRRA